MKSFTLGKSISNAEVLDITRNGLWLLAKGREYFLPYNDYPWFKNATIATIYKVELIHGRHLHWSDLDVDLELESLDHPEKYPLQYK